MAIAPLEIRALANILDELDYYQLLHLKPSASARDVKKAYYATSRTFHPDANGELAGEAREQCVRISKRITEAYCVLKDPRKRQVYDRRTEEAGVRMQIADARAQAKQESKDREAQTPQGKQFVQRAAEDVAGGDYAAAIRNLQTALTFEPGNDALKSRLEEVKKQRAEDGA